MSIKDQGGSSGFQIWDVKAGTCLKTLGGIGHIYEFQLLSTGQVIVLVGKKLALNGRFVSDFYIQLWDVKASTYITIFNIADSRRSIYILQALPTDDLLIQSGRDNVYEVCRVDIKSGAFTNSFKVTHFIKYSRLLSTGELVLGGENVIQLFDMKTASCLKTFHIRHPIVGLQLLPTDKLVIGTNDGTIQLLDMKTGTNIKTFSIQERSWISVIQLLSTGVLVIGVPKQGIYSRENPPKITVYDMKTGASLNDLHVDADVNILELQYCLQVSW